MNFRNLPWIRVGLVLGLIGYGYREFTKEPIVYHEAEISEVRSLDDEFVSLQGIPYNVSYSRHDDKAAIAFILRNNGDYVLCYSEGRVFRRDQYLEAKALIDYCAADSDSVKLNGKIKDGVFVFELPSNLEDIVLRK